MYTWICSSTCVAQWLVQICPFLAARGRLVAVLKVERALWPRDPEYVFLLGLDFRRSDTSQMTLPMSTCRTSARSAQALRATRFVLGRRHLPSSHTLNPSYYAVHVNILHGLKRGFGIKLASGGF